MTVNQIEKIRDVDILRPKIGRPSRSSNLQKIWILKYNHPYSGEHARMLIFTAIIRKKGVRVTWRDLRNGARPLLFAFPRPSAIRPSRWVYGTAVIEPGKNGVGTIVKIYTSNPKELIDIVKFIRRFVPQNVPLVLTVSYIRKGRHSTHASNH